MQIFKCSLVQFPVPREECRGDRKAKVNLVDNDLTRILITSRVKMIDFENGIMVTQNSIYLFGRTP